MGPPDPTSQQYPQSSWSRSGGKSSFEKGDRSCEDDSESESEGDSPRSNFQNGTLEAVTDLLLLFLLDLLDLNKGRPQAKQHGVGVVLR